MSAPGHPKREDPPGRTARSAKGAYVVALGRPKREVPPGGSACNADRACAIGPCRFRREALAHSG